MGTKKVEKEILHLGAKTFKKHLKKVLYTYRNNSKIVFIVDKCKISPLKIYKEIGISKSKD